MTNLVRSVHVALVPSTSELDPNYYLLVPIHSQKGSVSRTLVTPPHSFFLKSSGCHLKFCTMNVRSLKNKSADFMDFVCTSNADIFALTETWLKDIDSAHRSEATPSGYMLVDHARGHRRGGGTALLLRDSMEVKKVAAAEKTSFEFLEWLVGVGSHQLRVVVIYRPPYSTNHRVTLNSFFTRVF